MRAGAGAGREATQPKQADHAARLCCMPGAATAQPLLLLCLPPPLPDRPASGIVTGTDYPGVAAAATAVPPDSATAARAATAATVVAARAAITARAAAFGATDGPQNPGMSYASQSGAWAKWELPQYAAHNCIWHAIGMSRPGQLKNDLASVSLKIEVNVPSAGSAVPSHQCWHA